MKCTNPSCEDGKVFFTTPFNCYLAECPTCKGTGELPHPDLENNLEAQETIKTRDKSMNIGQAIEAVKSGKPIRRNNCNGKGMHIYLEDMFSFTVGDGVFKGQERKYEPCLCLYVSKTDSHQPGWNASTPDLLANDWEIVTHE